MGANQRSRITMSDEEITQLLEQNRTATMATIGPTGHIHLVAMWYAVIDGRVWFETKAKSQKVANLRRDARISVSVENGATYDQLRGVCIEGEAVISEDPDEIWAVGVEVWERYTGPYSEESRPMVEAMLAKRVAVRVDPVRTRSWDHRKLDMPAMELGGSTAPFVTPR